MSNKTFSSGMSSKCFSYNRVAEQSEGRKTNFKNGQSSITLSQEQKEVSIQILLIQFTDYLKHAPCFKAMLLEGGACHEPYARLKAVTVAIDPASGRHLYDGAEPDESDNALRSRKAARPAPHKHYPIDSQLIADMCWCVQPWIILRLPYCVVHLNYDVRTLRLNSI